MGSSSGRQFVQAVLYGMFFILLCKQSSRWKSVFDTHNARCKKNIKNCIKFLKIWKLFGILKVLVGVDVFMAVYMCEVKICITFKCNPVTT